MILVTTYTNPDLDGFAAAITYAEFLNKKGRKAQAGFLGRYNAEVLFAADRFGIVLPEPLSSIGDFEEIVLVDVSDLKRLPSDFPANKVKEVIDHREIFDAAAFPQAQFQIDKMAISATIVAEKFKQENIEIDSAMNTLLTAAIACHTLNFQTATERDKTIFQWLDQKQKLPEDFIRGVFQVKSDLTGEKLKQNLIEDFKWFDIAGRKIGIAQLQTVLAEELIGSRQREILEALHEIQTSFGTDSIFLLVQDLEKSKTFFVTADVEAKNEISRIMGLVFEGNIAVTSKLLLRKFVAKTFRDNVQG